MRSLSVIRVKYPLTRYVLHGCFHVLSSKFFYQWQNPPAAVVLKPASTLRHGSRSGARGGARQASDVSTGRRRLSLDVNVEGASGVLRDDEDARRLASGRSKRRRT